MSLLQKKIEEWRALPEEARLRKATRLTWISGIVLVALWGAVLLPFQLYIQGKDGEGPSVQGLQTQSEPTSATASPTPSQSTVPTPTIELRR